MNIIVRSEHHFVKLTINFVWFFRFLWTELPEGKFFFNAVKEGDSVVFACDDENECAFWVMAMYRATGQAHKPTPLVQTSLHKNSTMSRLQGGILL